jgi:hypothetical protein
LQVPEQQQQRQQHDAQQQASGDVQAGTSAKGHAIASPAALSPEVHAMLTNLLKDKASLVHHAAARIQANFRGYRVRRAYQTYRLGGPVSELLYSPAAYGIDLSAKDMVKPRPRAAPLLCVLRNTLWLLGGQVEIATKDIVLGEETDCWHSPRTSK